MVLSCLLKLGLDPKKWNRSTRLVSLPLPHSMKGRTNGKKKGRLRFPRDLRPLGPELPNNELKSERRQGKAPN